MQRIGMFKLSDFIGGRDNNFNLMRLIAAVMVLYSHSFALAVGLSSAEPWLQFGITPGSVAVDIFFVTSGFLVTGSLVSRKELCSFVMARVLRIYPALLVMLVLTIFVLGAYFTTLTLHDYFTDIETLKYGAKNSILIAGSYSHLPFVFEDNPFRKAVNGSLWTMPWELRMYVILLCIGVIVKMSNWREIVWKLLVIATLVSVVILYIMKHYYSITVLITDERVLRLSFMFFVGATFYAIKNVVYIGHWSGFLVGIIIILAATVGQWLFLPIYTVCIAYLLLHLAYLPSGIVRKFNNLGDYSYGVYIYAFPIQQSVVALVPGISGLNLFLAAFPLVLLCSIFSWHVVEKRCLNLKNRKIICN